MDQKNTLALLKNGSYGVLSTVGTDNQPYGIPLCYIYMEDSLYFHCAVTGHKLDNIANNLKVSFCVIGVTQVLPSAFSVRYESVIVFGRASEVTGFKKNTILDELIKKYSPDHIRQGKDFIQNKIGSVKTFEISIDNISGKARY